MSFTIRIVKIDHYLTSPIPELDIVYSEFRGNPVKQVPVIRVFGANHEGHKTCLHIHRVFPYLYIPHNEIDKPNISKLSYRLATGLDKAINISLGQADSVQQHVYDIVPVAAMPIYGYHNKKHKFLKIRFYNPFMVKKAATLLQNGAVLNTIYQPHEAHINYELQFMIDYNLHGMNNIILSKVMYRSDNNTENIPNDLILPDSVSKISTCKFEVDCLAQDIINRDEIVSGKLSANPGIAAIWEEERERRRKQKKTSQIMPQVSQDRLKVPTDSELCFMNKLRERLKSFQLKINESDVSVPSTSNSNRSVYPAEVADDEYELVNASGIEDVTKAKDLIVAIPSQDIDYLPISSQPSTSQTELSTSPLLTCSTEAYRQLLKLSLENTDLDDDDDTFVNQNLILSLAKSSPILSQIQHNINKSDVQKLYNILKELEDCSDVDDDSILSQKPLYDDAEEFTEEMFRNEIEEQTIDRSNEKKTSDNTLRNTDENADLFHLLETMCEPDQNTTKSRDNVEKIEYLESSVSSDKNTDQFLVTSDKGVTSEKSEDTSLENLIDDLMDLTNQQTNSSQTKSKQDVNELIKSQQSDEPDWNDSFFDELLNTDLNTPETSQKPEPVSSVSRSSQRKRKSLSQLSDNESDDSDIFDVSDSKIPQLDGTFDVNIKKKKKSKSLQFMKHTNIKKKYKTRFSDINTTSNKNLIGQPQINDSNRSINKRLNYNLIDFKSITLKKYLTFCLKSSKLNMNMNNNFVLDNETHESILNLSVCAINSILDKHKVKIGVNKQSLPNISYLKKIIYKCINQVLKEVIYKKDGKKIIFDSSKYILEPKMTAINEDIISNAVVDFCQQYLKFNGMIKESNKKVPFNNNNYLQYDNYNMYCNNLFVRKPEVFNLTKKNLKYFCRKSNKHILCLDGATGLDSQSSSDCASKYSNKPYKLNKSKLIPKVDNVNVKSTVETEITDKNDSKPSELSLLFEYDDLLNEYNKFTENCLDECHQQNLFLMNEFHTTNVDSHVEAPCLSVDVGDTNILLGVNRKVNDSICDLSRELSQILESVACDDFVHLDYMNSLCLPVEATVIKLIVSDMINTVLTFEFHVKDIELDKLQDNHQIVNVFFSNDTNVLMYIDFEVFCDILNKIYCSFRDDANNSNVTVSLACNFNKYLEPQKLSTFKGGNSNIKVLDVHFAKKFIKFLKKTDKNFPYSESDLINKLKNKELYLIMGKGKLVGVENMSSENLLKIKDIFDLTSNDMINFSKEYNKYLTIGEHIQKHNSNKQVLIDNTDVCNSTVNANSDKWKNTQFRILYADKTKNNSINKNKKGSKHLVDNINVTSKKKSVQKKCVTNSITKKDIGKNAEESCLFKKQKNTVGVKNNEWTKYENDSNKIKSNQSNINSNIQNKSSAVRYYDIDIFSSNFPQYEKTKINKIKKSKKIDKTSSDHHSVNEKKLLRNITSTPKLCNKYIPNAHHHNHSKNTFKEIYTINRNLNNEKKESGKVPKLIIIKKTKKIMSSFQNEMIDKSIYELKNEDKIDNTLKSTEIKPKQPHKKKTKILTLENIDKINETIDFVINKFVNMDTPENKYSETKITLTQQLPIANNDMPTIQNENILENNKQTNIQEILQNKNITKCVLDEQSKNAHIPIQVPNLIENEIVENSVQVNGNQTFKCYKNKRKSEILPIQIKIEPPERTFDSNTSYFFEDLVSESDFDFSDTNATLKPWRFNIEDDIKLFGNLSQMDSENNKNHDNNDSLKDNTPKSSRLLLNKLEFTESLFLTPKKNQIISEKSKSNEWKMSCKRKSNCKDTVLRQSKRLRSTTQFFNFNTETSIKQDLNNSLEISGNQNETTPNTNLIYDPLTTNQIKVSHAEDVIKKKVCKKKEKKKIIRSNIKQKNVFSEDINQQSVTSTKQLEICNTSECYSPRKTRSQSKMAQTKLDMKSDKILHVDGMNQTYPTVHNVFVLNNNMLNEIIKYKNKIYHPTYQKMFKNYLQRQKITYANILCVDGNLDDEDRKAIKVKKSKKKIINVGLSKHKNITDLNPVVQLNKTTIDSKQIKNDTTVNKKSKITEQKSKRSKTPVVNRQVKQLKIQKQNKTLGLARSRNKTLKKSDNLLVKTCSVKLNDIAVNQKKYHIEENQFKKIPSEKKLSVDLVDIMKFPDIENIKINKNVVTKKTKSSNLPKSKYKQLNIIKESPLKESNLKKYELRTSKRKQNTNMDTNQSDTANENNTLMLPSVSPDLNNLLNTMHSNGQGEFPRVSDSKLHYATKRNGQSSPIFVVNESNDDLNTLSKDVIEYEVINEEIKIDNSTCDSKTVDNYNDIQFSNKCNSSDSKTCDSTVQKSDLSFSPVNENTFNLSSSVVSDSFSSSIRDEKNKIIKTNVKKKFKRLSLKHTIVYENKICDYKKNTKNTIVSVSQIPYVSVSENINDTMPVIKCDISSSMINSVNEIDLTKSRLSKLEQLKNDNLNLNVSNILPDSVNEESSVENKLRNQTEISKQYDIKNNFFPQPGCSKDLSAPIFESVSVKEKLDVPLHLHLNVCSNNLNSDELSEINSSFDENIKNKSNNASFENDSDLGIVSFYDKTLLDIESFNNTQPCNDAKENTEIGNTVYSSSDTCEILSNQNKPMKRLTSEQKLKLTQNLSILDASFIELIPHGRFTEDGCVVLMPMFNPPSRIDIESSMVEFEIPEVRSVEPFYGNPNDVTGRVEIGHKILKVPSLTTKDLLDFESVLEYKTIEYWRNYQVKTLQTSFDNLEKASTSNLLQYFASNETRIITPSLLPPTKRDVEMWLRAKNVVKVQKKEKKSKLKIFIPSSPTGNGDSSDESLTLSPCTPQSDNLLSPLSSQSSTPKSSIQSVNITPHRSTRESNDVNLENENSRSVSPVFKNKKRIKKQRKNLRNKALCMSLTKSFAEHTKMSTIVENEMLKSDKESEIAELLTSDTNSNNSDDSLKQMMEKTQFRKQLVSPVNINSSCRISGATLDNTYGFKVPLENLKNAKAVTEYQYLTVFVTELHTEARAGLKPNPEFDKIRTLFYTIYNDVPENFELPRHETGIICVDESGKQDYLEGCDKNVTITYVESEKELIEKLIFVFNKWDPDILIGYEIEMLSWGYLFERSFILEINLPPKLSRISDSKNNTKLDDAGRFRELNLVGRIVLDLWRLMRHEIALNSYTFENVFYHVLHERIPKHSFQDLNFWYEHNTKLYRWITVDYYIKRIEGTMKLLDQLDLIGRTCELARLFGIQFYEVLSRGSQFRVESMMLRLAKPLNYISVSPSVQQRANMKAPEFLPLIMEPQSKMYTDPVIVLDFQSLYPSMIIAYNYCFSTCLGRVELLGHSEPFEFGANYLKTRPAFIEDLLLKNKLNISPCGVAFVDQSVRLGILPRMLKEILDTRLMVKQSMKENKDDATLQRVLHSRQLGLKLIANVTYGYTAANFSGRMPCIEVGDSVVSKGRETLERAIKLVENNSQWRAKVVYGDTDSLFVLIPGRSRQDAFKIGSEIAEAVTNDNPTPVKLKLEKVYQPCILQTKKRYVGYMYESPDQEEPEYNAKGIETVRRDGCPAVGKILEKTLRLLFETKDMSIVKEYVCKQFTKILTGRANIQDLIFAREFRGANGYRPNAMVPSLVLARRYKQQDPRGEPRRSERVPYIIIHGAPGTTLVRLSRGPHEMLNDPSLRPHAEYYITRVIAPALNRCLNLCGVDVHTWFNELPRKLTRYFQSSVKDNKKSTISQHFAISNCVSCNGLTKDGVCENCKRNPQKTCITIQNKLQQWERHIESVKKICQSCCGRPHQTNCVSLDCPVLYRFHQTKRDADQIPFVRQIHDNTLSELLDF